jgi:hypothetical protein
MAYTAWSVVFGEQPTAAKWNQLGANDAGFKDGTNIDNLAILTRHLADSNVTGVKIGSYRTRRQNNGSNTDETAALIQTGWFAEVPGVASGSIKTITFPTAFSAAPLVYPVYGGDQVSGAQALGNGGNSVKDEAVCKAYDVTATGCKIRTVSRDASNFAAGNIYYVHWLAIGV